MEKEIIALTERQGLDYPTVTYRVELQRIKDCFDRWTYWVVVEKPWKFADFEFGYNFEAAMDYYRSSANFANTFDLAAYDCEAYA